MDKNIRKYENLIELNDKAMHKSAVVSGVSIICGIAFLGASVLTAQHDFNTASKAFEGVSYLFTALSAVSAFSSIAYAKSLVSRENQLRRYLIESKQNPDRPHLIPSHPLKKLMFSK